MCEDVFEIEILFQLYKGHNGNKVYEQYSGIVAKNRTGIYQKTGSMEFLLSDGFFVKLNHEEKVIMAGEFPGEEAAGIWMINVSDIMENYNTDKIYTRENLHIIELTVKDDRISEVGKLILEIDKSHGYISKQIMFFSTASDFSVYDEGLSDEKNFDSVRLEISFSNYKKTTDDWYFNKERYFIKKGSTVFLGNEFRDYYYISVN